MSRDPNAQTKREPIPCPLMVAARVHVPRTMFLREEIASGKLKETGEEIEVSLSGGGAILVRVGKTLDAEWYEIPADALVDAVLLHRRGKARCEVCRRPYSASEARAGYTTCEHCA